MRNCLDRRLGLGLMAQQHLRRRGMRQTARNTAHMMICATSATGRPSAAAAHHPPTGPEMLIPAVTATGGPAAVGRHRGVRRAMTGMTWRDMTATRKAIGDAAAADRRSAMRGMMVQHCGGMAQLRRVQVHSTGWT